MKKIVISVAVLFIFSMIVPLMVHTASASAEKIEKKSDEAVVDPVVYVSGSGKKYHKKNCKIVPTGKKGIKLSEAEEQGYEPCKACFGSEIVYMTETGKKFHKKDCVHNKDGKPIIRDLAELKGLEPCLVCLPPTHDKEKEQTE